MNREQHRQIQYSQSWEDADILLKALDIGSGDHVLSITSGGCNTLSLLSQGPGKLTAVDINPAQNHLFELKWTAIRELKGDEFFAFLGIYPSDQRLASFEKLLPLLSEEAASYWQSGLKDIKSGIIHCGRFEHYLQIFRKRILPVIHSGKTVKELLREKSGDEQNIFFHNRWMNLRWKWMFHLFFSKPVMRKLGRGPEMFRYANTGSVSKHYLLKTERALTSASVFHNPYLNYILLGDYGPASPHFLRKDSLEQIRSSRLKPLIVHADLLDYLSAQPDHSISAFNLSDVFEPLSEAKTNALFHRIVRTGKNGARLIFWNNLVKRDVPESLHQNFKEEKSLCEKLHAQEKIFFYNDLKIYTLVK